MRRKKKMTIDLSGLELGDTAGLFRRVSAVLAPPPELTVSQWADRYRKLTSVASAEPGQWNTDRAPYQREIMDAVNDPRVTEIVAMTSAQIGKSEILLNIIGYYIDYDPAPILALQPTIEMGEAFSKDRIAPMLEASPALRGKVKDPRSRDSGNTLRHKALDINTPIATLDGWKTMGTIKCGDTVFDNNGKPCLVTYVTPIVEGRPCYRITFSDGAEIVADEEHPWVIERHKLLRVDGKKKQVRVTETVTTKDLLENTKRRWQRAFAVRMQGPIDLPDRELPIPPYVLGAWLGDGMSHAPRIVAGPQDYEMQDILSKYLGEVDAKFVGNRLWHFNLDPEKGKEKCCKYGHVKSKYGQNKEGKCKECGRQKRRFIKTGVAGDKARPNNIRSWMLFFGLLTPAGAGYTNKHIPERYLRSSARQRLDLLRGLMDTDGCIRASGKCTFVTTAQRLAGGVEELLNSLGILFTVKKETRKLKVKGKIVECKDAYVFTFTAPPHLDVFKLTRKANRQKDCKTWANRNYCRLVRSVVPVESRPVRCISVDSEGRMYLAGKGMVPTHNTFPGGHLTIAGANSPASLASRPVRVVLCDEVDRYPASAGTEGDPVNLAKKRTTSFWNRKSVLTSTPTIRGMSRIEAAYEASSRGRWHVPCPDCGHMQFYRWGQLDFDTGMYACEACGTLNRETAWKAGAGQWVHEDPDNPVRGFHLNEMASPWRRWSEMIADFREAKRKASAGNPELLKTWVNTALGETWEEDGDSIEIDDLEKRREYYNAELPEGVLVLSAGVDVQDDRIELEVVGWGAEKESWGIDYKVLYGDPAQDSLWLQLDGHLQRVYQFDDGRALSIGCTCIDSGGHYTDEVYKFCKPREHRRVFAVKGKGGAGVPVVGKASRANRRKVALFPVGDDMGKELVFSRLRVPHEGPGYCHFPRDAGRGYDAAYFKGLVSEKRVLKYVKGRPKIEWVKTTSGARNEPLDCRKYATAALEILNPPLAAIAKRSGGGDIHAQQPRQAPASATRPARKRRVLGGGVRV